MTRSVSEPGLGVSVQLLVTQCPAPGEFPVRRCTMRAFPLAGALPPA